MNVVPKYDTDFVIPNVREGSIIFPVQSVRKRVSSTEISHPTASEFEMTGRMKDVVLIAHFNRDFSPDCVGVRNDRGKGFGL
jgi:hypothetical protein